MKILVVEDNDIVRNNILKYLEIKWDNAMWHSTFEGAVYKIMTGSFDIIILDLGLGSGDEDGIMICKQLREKWNAIPILMLTARTQTQQKVLGLDAGADDYLTKPFDYTELYSRVQALVRRNYSLKWEVLKFNDLEVHADKMEVYQSGKEVQLSKLEFQLLVYIMQNNSRVISKTELQEKVWGEYDVFEESRSVDIYIWYLRKKLWKDVVKTVRWLGYIMD